VAECITLLGTSALETLTADRSAEATDAVIALPLALVYVMLDRERPYAKSARWAAAGRRRTD
jgi:hypothetical protein